MNRFRDSRLRTLALTFLVVTVVLAVALASRAADEPTPLRVHDDVPGSFRPWAFTGKHIETLRRRILATIRTNDDALLKAQKENRAKALTGMFHCPLSENGLNPMVLLFVKGSEPTDAVLQLVQKLDEIVPKYEKERLGIVVVFLDMNIKDITLDDEARNAATRALEPKLAPFANVTAAVDGWESLKEQYKLNPDNDVTFVMSDKLRVGSIRLLANADLDAKGIETLVQHVEDKIKTPTKLKPPREIGEK
jgi:hypothetical protein